MPVKRRVLKERNVITPEVLAIFAAMRRLKCKCPPHDWNEWVRPCAACERWWRLNDQLCDLLILKPWQYPSIEDPRTRNPYPRGSRAHAEWTPDWEARDRWQMLEQGAHEVYKVHLPR